MKLKSIQIIIFFLMSWSYESFSQTSTDIIISEYIEGSSNNKALEFYNGTGSSIDLTAGNYIVQLYFNGSSTSTTTIVLTGTIPANGVFVLAHSSASFVGSSFVNQASASLQYNGDDAVVLRKGGASGTILDVIGQVGFDPGTEWGSGLSSTQDNTIRRKSSVCSGDVNVFDVFDPSIEWDGFAIDVFTGLGTHTASCTSAAQITTSPSSLTFNTIVGTPSAEQSYTVQGTNLSNDITAAIPPGSDFGLSLVSGGPYTGSVLIPAASANAGPVPVFVIFNPASTGIQSGNITNTSGTSSANVAVQGTGTNTSGTTHIYEIQGSGSASPFTGTTVTTEGIVTGDFQGTNQLGGFYVQDTTGDGNNLTSDGVFVFDTSFHVNVGDYVKFTGLVEEFFTKTELKNISSGLVLSTGNSLMAPVLINLPVDSVTMLERYEGMRVSFPQTLTVSETFTLGRFGEVLLSADGRLFTPTNFVDPNDSPASGTSSSGNSNVAAVTAQQDLNNRSQILLDDGSSVQNPPVVPYLNPSDSTLRIGSTLSNLTGNLDFDFSVYRLQPTVSPSFNYAVRPSAPVVGGNVKVGSFNVLNYFNGNGLGGGFPTARGANTLTEFNRQRAKIIAAISTLNPDILGLTEIENDGDGANSAIADLVNGLNAVTAPGTYAYVADPTGSNGNTGTDAIKVAIIYKPSVVTTQGLSVADINPVNNRPPVAQTFTVNNSGEKFTVIINHLKSKGCTGATGANIDQGDGQSCFNNTRKLQANALLSFIATLQTQTGDQDVISLGDYNSYEEEDPIDILRAGGLVNAVQGPGIYSYVFDGQSGSLDYAFVTPSLSSNIAAANKWHINADEPIVKDYNQEFNPAYVYSPDAYRSSDHDPVLVGLNLLASSITITSPANNSSFAAGTAIALNTTVSTSNDTVTKVAFYNYGIRFAEDSTAPYGFTGMNVEPGTYLVTAIAFFSNGDSTVSDTVHITVTGCNGSGNITAEGYTGIPGTQVADLTSSPNYPNNPDVLATLNKFEYGPNYGDNYGARVRGYICAPVTGNYTFYIAGDEQDGLWLSTDENPANKVLIAYNVSHVNSRAWYTTPTQKSAPIRLLKGARYYIETLHKEATGADHLAVAWQIPGGPFEGPIPGSRLSPIGSAFPNRPVARNFGTAMEKAMTKNIKGLVVTATPNPSSSYFTINTQSNSNEVVNVIVTDAMGRIIMKKANNPANSIIRFGEKLPAGIYFVEIQQGSQKERLKLVKQ